MSIELRAYTVTIPANTPLASPVAVDLSFPPRQVDTIEVVVPSGSNGLMGFAITSAGTQVIPINAGAFIVANNDKMIWPLEALNDSGSWGVIGYNTGGYDHSFYLRFLLSVVPSTLPGGLALPSISDLSGGVSDLAGLSIAAQAQAETIPVVVSPQPVYVNPPPTQPFTGPGPAFRGPP